MRTLDKPKKHLRLPETAPNLDSCRELLRFNSCDGKKRAKILGETLLKLVKTCSELMISGVMVNKDHLKPDENVKILKNAAAMYDMICPDGNYGLYHSNLTKLYLYMSEHLWRNGDYDEAFEALNLSLKCARAYEDCSGQAESRFTAPLLRQVKINPEGYTGLTFTSSLSEDWPWWGVPDCSKVKAEMQADPRWDEWVKQTRE